MRGEHKFFQGHSPGQRGSSPRARGTPSALLACVILNGIIPACAGNTSLHLRSDSAWRDHPRVRGEHAKHCVFMTYMSGSSPRARGTHLLRLVRDHVTGIIPACAGNTIGGFMLAKEGQDHPRVRGEHGLRPSGYSLFQGSSPRARGTRLLGLGPFRLLGIIPACAGNTRSVRPFRP